MRLCPSTSTPFCPLLFGTCILVSGWYHHDKSFHSQSRMNSYILSLFERRLNSCRAIRRFQKRLHPGSAQWHRSNLLDTWRFFIFYSPEMLACASFLFLFQVWETSFWLSPVQITENSSFSSLFFLFFNCLSNTFSKWGPQKVSVLLLLRDAGAKKEHHHHHPSATFSCYFMRHF